MCKSDVINNNENTQAFIYRHLQENQNRSSLQFRSGIYYSPEPSKFVTCYSKCITDGCLCAYICVMCMYVCNVYLRMLMLLVSHQEGYLACKKLKSTLARVLFWGRV